MFLMASKDLGQAQENRDLFNNLSQDAYYVTVDGTHHGSFSDQTLLVKRAFLFGLYDKVVSGLDLLDGYKAQEIIQALVVDFFDKYLQQKSVRLLDGIDKKSKQVAIEHK